MADQDSRLRALITRGREDRNVEYKGARGRETFAWGSDTVNAALVLLKLLVRDPARKCESGLCQPALLPGNSADAARTTPPIM